MSKNETPVGTDLAKPAPHTVDLDTPIVRGEQTISRVTLRKPAAGELRGIALADLLRLEVGSLHTLLPRITTPTLTTQDVAKLDPCDLVAIGGEVVGFFMTRAERVAASPTA